ncbi:MAG: hypothetical protein EHM72_07360 [Calditrichaeota bacterium]|nr:MAG: hypothetical protein EHM72_07360 [Calditrichota bacterium]
MLIWLFPVLASLSGQEIRSIKVIDGVKAFYMADFEGARAILQDALLNSRLGDEDLFAAHVYIAFSYMREELEPETAQMYVVKAVEIAPDVQLDAGKIPPDLFSQYMQIRQSVIGSLKIQTTPMDASAILIEPAKNRVLNIQTPGVFENLPAGTYDLLVTLTGHQSYSTTILIGSGENKEIDVFLLEKQRGFIKKYWPYGAGALAAVVVAAVVSGGDGNGSRPLPSENLPLPPNRPSKP